MAYFECIIGGSGTTLTVTCDSVFAGQTITCTNGTTTLTAVCPSASPYVVEFDLETDGTWTISGTVNGKTHSTSVTINTNATLHEIPTGSSATPVANVQTWLHCANIWNKSYTTITQVLSDTTTLLALISSNNAADYMARSTSWASSVTANSTAMTYIGNNDYCADKLLSDSTWLNAICNSTYFESVLNVKVPTMTSNTTPSGVASASSEPYTSQGYYAYKAFMDGTANYDFWIGMKSNAWLQYQFPSAIKVRKVYVKNCNGGGNNPYYMQGFTIQGSNNGSTFTNLGTGTITQSANTEKTITFVNNNAYKYYRIVPDMGSMSWATVGRLQLYGRA